MPADQGNPRVVRQERRRLHALAIREQSHDDTRRVLVGRQSERGFETRGKDEVDECESLYG